MTPRTDQQLIDAINAGDAGGDGATAGDAFEELYLRYKQWVANLAFRFTGDRDLALDVTQETFIYLLRKFPGFELTAQLKTFLYPVVRHLALAARQKSRRFAGSVDVANLDDAAIYNSGPAQESAATPRTGGAAAGVTGDPPLGDLAALVDDLPAGQREVLILRFVEGLPLSEIADALGLPLGTVKSRLHNALQTLRADPPHPAVFRVKGYFTTEITETTEGFKRDEIKTIVGKGHRCGFH